MKNRLKDYLSYFLVCFVVGALTFGGGYAIYPVLEKEFVDKRGYISKDEMADIVAVSQSIPGLLTLNAIILIGYRRRRFLCALAGVLGVVIPSVVIICLITLAYSRIIANRYVQAVFTGVRAGVIALLVHAVVRMIKSSIVDVPTIILFVLAAALLGLRQAGILPWLNPIYVILFGAAVGLILKLLIQPKLKHKKSGKKPDAGGKL